MAIPQRQPETSSPPIEGDARVPLGTILAYGPPVFGVASMLFFVQFFFLKFATDVLLIAPGIVGLIFGVGRLWDAITDPLVGTWSDRTRTRLGRRRPWMLVGAPLMGISFALLFIPPQALQGSSLVAWCAVALFGFYAALTTYMVPHSALGAELTPNHHARSMIFGVRSVFFTLGMFVAFVGMQYVTTSETPRQAALNWSLALAVAFSLLLLVTPTRVKERAEFQGRGSDHPVRAMRDVLRNKHARLLLFVQFIEMAGAGVLGALSPYMLQYVLKRPDLIAPLPAVFIVCSVASVPLWVMASRRFGKKRVWICAMVGSGVGFGASAFAGANDWIFMTIVLIVAGVSAGCGGAIGPSILADVIDSDEYETGERKEGVYSAAWGFAIKAGGALIVVAAGFALQLSGFQPNQEQTRTAEITLRAIYGGIPFTMYIVGALVFRHFSLDEAEHARIRAELEARR